MQFGVEDDHVERRVAFVGLRASERVGDRQSRQP